MTVAVLLLAAVTWTRWETTIPAPAEAVFAGPSGESVRVPSFTAPDGKERLRFAFPSAGVWRWQAGDATGTVQVTGYRGSNPLYRHGFLKPSPNGRYLMHADGTPFLWIGDTAWFASSKATTEEWAGYLSIRARQRFSVVQISAGRVPGGWTGPGPADPAYWDRIDALVRMANERGMVVLMVGLGRPTDPAHVPLVSSPEYVRQIVGRFSGDHVIFSPNFDGAYDPVLDTVAENLYALDKRHMITQHPNTRKGQNEIYVPKDYLAFSGLQSGHNAGKLDVAYAAAHDWALNLWTMKPVRPVINIEGMYDGRGSDEGPAWRAQDVRKIGWISWLAGALGYTYGAGETSRKVPGTNGGVWGWNQDESAFDHWRKAARWPSASHMTVMRDFFASIDWWRLVPVHRFAAQADDGSFAVVYAPDGGTPDLNWFPKPFSLEYLDPVTGKRGKKAPPGEAVLLLRRK